jgi:hypothetical protein
VQHSITEHSDVMTALMLLLALLLLGPVAARWGADSRDDFHPRPCWPQRPFRHGFLG